MKPFMENQPYYKFLKTIPSFGAKMGHNGILAILHELGNFHKCLNIIHIAGTNGKGSCTKILSSIYHAAGYKTASFTSPYISDYRECIFINELEIDIPLMNVASSKIAKAYQSLVTKNLPLPTHYECITVTAFMAMYLEKAEICIIETLMGGLHDATNIISKPLSTLITSISIDHTNYLGTSIEEIAVHKAGIIKKNCPVVVNLLNNDAYAIIEETALANNSLLIDSYTYVKHKYNLDKLNLYAKTLVLKGDHQYNNLCGVLSTIHILHNKYPVHHDEIINGLSKVIHPCRIEAITFNNHNFIFDGAHNEDGILALINYLKNNYSKHSITFILGILEDKDISMITQHIYTIAHKVILTKPINPRSFNPHMVLQQLELSQKSITTISNDFKDIVVQIQPNKATNTLFVVCGSLYLCTPFKEYLSLSTLSL